MYVYKGKHILFDFRHKNETKKGHVCEYIHSRGPLAGNLRFIEITFICAVFEVIYMLYALKMFVLADPFMCLSRCFWTLNSWQQFIQYIDLRP